MIRFYDVANTAHIAQATLKRATGVNGSKTVTGEIIAGNAVINGIGRGWSLVFDDEPYVITYTKVNDQTKSVEFDAIQKFFWDFAKSGFYQEWNGSHTFTAYLNALFENTGYEYILDVDVAAFEKENWGMKNRLTLFNDVISQAGVEFELIGKRVKITKAIGSDLSTIVRKGFNLSDMVSESSITDFVTYGKGFGAFNDSNDHSKGRMEVEYKSPLADTYGVLEADPVVDERYTIAGSLLAAVKAKVDDSVAISIDLKIYDLPEADFTYQVPQAGDWIMAIDEAIGFSRRIRIIKVDEEFDVNGQRINYTATCGDLPIAVQQELAQSGQVHKLEQLTKDVDAAAINANGKNTNYYGAAEPSRPREGDLWYKENGDNTELYVWADGRWEIVVSKNTNDIIDQKVDAATAEITGIRDQADAAVSTANQAVAAAGFNADQIATIKSDMATAISQASTAYDSANIAMADAATALSTAQDAQSTGIQTAKIVDDLNGTVTELTKQTTVIDGQVQTVNTMAQKALDGLTLKSDITTVNILQGTVNSIKGELDVQANLISAKVTASDVTGMLGNYATQSWSEGKISAAKNEISASVETVKNTVDAMSFSNRNLFRGYPTNNKMRVNKNNIYYYDYPFKSNGTRILLKPNTEYTVTWDYEVISGDMDSAETVSVGRGNEQSDFAIDSKSVAISAKKITIKTPADVSDFPYFALRFSRTNVPETSVIDYWDIAIREGNINSGWSPAPEDQATIDWTKSQLDIKDGKISAAVTSLKSDIATATAGMATQTWTQDKLSITSSALTNTISGVSDIVANLSSRNYYQANTQISVLTGAPVIDHNDETINGFKITGISGQLSSVRLSKVITGNGWWTFSFDLHANQESALIIDFCDLPPVTVKFTKDTKRYSLSVNVTNASASYDFIDINNLDWAYFWFDNVTVQKGKADLGWTPAPEDQATVADVSSQFTQLKDDINLRVKTGDLISQINVSAGNVLIQSGKLYLDAASVVMGGTAFINAANIKSVNASTITTGTLDAATVNVIGLNANNITTGTISGANLSINLTTGQVVFQRGRIHSASNNVDINVDQGYMSVANSNARVMLKNGGIQFVQPNVFDVSTNPYLSISNGGSGLAFTGARIVGRDYAVLSNSANASNIFDIALGGAETFAGISMGYDGSDWHPTKIGGADRGIILSAGRPLPSDVSTAGSPATIRIGTTDQGDWGGNRIELIGDYVYSLSTYTKTASGSANVIVSPDGALIRSTSASKYKTDIQRTMDDDYGQKLLDLPTATWLDKADRKRYSDDPAKQPVPTRNFGMIAEDLAAAGLEYLVVRGADGQLEGIEYDRIGPALIPVIAKLQKRIEILEQLKGEI